MLSLCDGDSELVMAQLSENRDEFISRVSQALQAASTGTGTAALTAGGKQTKSPKAKSKSKSKSKSKTGKAGRRKRRKTADSEDESSASTGSDSDASAAEADRDQSGGGGGESECVLPDFIDQITKSQIVQPTLAPTTGIVLGYDTYVMALQHTTPQNRCPFTRQHVTRRSLIKLTRDNISEYWDRIREVNSASFVRQPPPLTPPLAATTNTGTGAAAATAAATATATASMLDE